MPQAAVRALVDLGEAPTAPAPPPGKLPPPSRTKPLSAAPPIPARAKPPTRPPPVPVARGQATQLGTAVPNPLRQSDDGLVTTDFEKAGTEDTDIAAGRSLDETFTGDTDVRDSTADIPTSAQERVSKTAVELIGRAETTPAPALIAPRGSNALLRAPIPAKTPAPTKVPLSTAPESLPPPAVDEQAAGGPSPACPQCESPMAWVEEHLRFYCKSCRMYF